MGHYDACRDYCTKCGKEIFRPEIGTCFKCDKKQEKKDTGELSKKDLLKSILKELEELNNRISKIEKINKLY